MKLLLCVLSSIIALSAVSPASNAYASAGVPRQGHTVCGRYRVAAHGAWIEDGSEKGVNLSRDERIFPAGLKAPRPDTKICATGTDYLVAGDEYLLRITSVVRMGNALNTYCGTFRLGNGGPRIDFSPGIGIHLPFRSLPTDMAPPADGTNLVCVTGTIVHRHGATWFGRVVAVMAPPPVVSRADPELASEANPSEEQTEANGAAAAL